MKRLLLALSFVLIALPPAKAASAQTAAQWSANGRALLDSGKSDAAVKAFERAVKLEESNSMYHMLLAQALGNVARSSNVVKQGLMAPRIRREMERARELDPNAMEPHQGLMQFYLEAPGFMGGSVAKARNEALEIFKLNRMRGRLAEAQIAQHEKDSTSLERAYRSAISEAPDSVVAAATLAFYLLNTRRTDEAFATMDAYIGRRPKDAMGQFYVGRLAAASGQQLDRGEAALRHYITLPADTADKTRATPANAHFRLGELLARKGDKAGAKIEFETALELNPRLDAARSALRGLK
jgi:tetratricopeptide (TPR) repeat protein